MKTRKVNIPALASAQYNGSPAPGWMTYTIFKCAICKRIRQSTSPHVTGYGIDKRKRKVCFTCCGDQDREAMRKGERFTLYLIKRPDGYHVTNWPGTLDIRPARVHSGHHNIARTRLDAWFSLDGFAWHGVNIGDDNDILRCRKAKARS